ncbi:MAG: cytochrome P460 family protein [Rhodospirillales bacterium]|nr:cytochrome P460 family protein [Rhodospirillales bacterium]
MSNLRGKLLSSTILPTILGLGAFGAVAFSASVIAAPAIAPPVRSANPSAAPNPTAARNPGGNSYLHLVRGCNPCAAHKGGNPCAAKNPCGARHTGCNPCAARNPCAAAGRDSECTVPRLVKLAAANPCAAKNPCGAMKGCNPCAAKNPCGAMTGCNPCNPCGPCGASPVVELTAAEAAAAYDCVKGELKAGYAKSGVAFAKSYQGVTRFNTVPYQSATHGNRFVNNYTSTSIYGKYEESGVMPKGALIAKDSFVVSPAGTVNLGPLFLMEKMSKGFDKKTGDWRYTMIMADGKVTGTTGGKGAGMVGFCADCHAGAEDQDYLFFIPEGSRK